MNLIHKVPTTSLLHGHCRHCGHSIVFHPRVGWIDPWPGDTYDICPENEVGRHVPEILAPSEVSLDRA